MQYIIKKLKSSIDVYRYLIFHMEETSTKSRPTTQFLFDIKYLEQFRRKAHKWNLCPRIILHESRLSSHKTKPKTRHQYRIGETALEERFANSVFPWLLLNERNSIKGEKKSMDRDHHPKPVFLTYARKYSGRTGRRSVAMTIIHGNAAVGTKSGI